jgi:hypothetical protein
MGKKAAKKKGKSKGKDVVIVLKDNQLPDPMDASARKNVPNGPGDRVRWDNQSSRGRTIGFDFDWWPFVEAPTMIEIEEGKKSSWFTISSTTPSSGYDYNVSPPLVPGSGPDDPAISVGD